jgi:hypothetical protein
MSFRLRTTGLSLREAVEWCSDGVTVREVAEPAILTA